MPYSHKLGLACRLHKPEVNETTTLGSVGIQRLHLVKWITLLNIFQPRRQRVALGRASRRVKTI